MMYLALTYDHRLLDGREAVTFLVKVCFFWHLPFHILFSRIMLTMSQQVKEYIEDPRRMLLG